AHDERVGPDRSRCDSVRRGAGGVGRGRSGLRHGPAGEVMAPVPRPIPRFIADNSQEGIPHGRFAERLSDAFAAACGEIDDLPGGVEPPQEIDWFPERAWGGRVWVPASARVDGPDGPLELFGHASY